MEEDFQAELIALDGVDEDFDYGDLTKKYLEFVEKNICEIEKKHGYASVKNSYSSTIKKEK
jgi:hypothetical protein